MSYIGNKEIVKVFIGNKEVTDIFVGNNKVYSSVKPAVCQIRNLGSENPSNVTFTKTDNFPTEAQAWEEVIIDGNSFAKFTPWFKKAIYNNGELTGFDIANKQVDNSYVPYDCFLDEDGNLLEYILIGRYCASNTSAIDSTNNTRATAQIGSWRALAKAKGTGYQIMDAAMFMFWRDLALAISENVNFNNGSGVASYLGLARMTDGGWWIDGLTHIDTTYLYCSKPSKYVDSPTASSDGYSALSYTIPTQSGGCISKLGYDTNHPTVNVPNEAVSNSSYNTYYCDGVYYNTGNRPCVVSVGDALAYLGLFCLSGNIDWAATRGARLCFKPSIQ